MITTITTILIALSLFVGGTGAAVYVSQDSVPGDMLYSVKTTSEDFQYLLEGDPQDRLELALKFAERRATEAKTLFDNGEQLPDSFIKRWEKNLASVLLAAAEVDEIEESMDQTQDGVMIHQRPQDRANDGDGATYRGNSADQQETIQLVEQALEDISVFKDLNEDESEGQLPGPAGAGNNSDSSNQGSTGNGPAYGPDDSMEGPGDNFNGQSDSTGNNQNGANSGSNSGNSPSGNSWSGQGGKQP